MPSDMSKCVNFSVFLDIAGVLKDAPSQKHYISIPLFVNGKWYWCWWMESQCPAIWPNVPFFTGTDIMSGMCGLSVPAIHICVCQTSLHIIFSFIFYRNNGNDLLNPD